MEAAAGKRHRPVRRDPELELIEQRGLEHEQTFLRALEASGRKVVTPVDQPTRSAGDLGEAHAATAALMRDGADVIYQGTLFDGRWLGRPDFLLRVEAPSDLGDWSYEVADAKLARHVKAAALIQCCVYSHLLTSVQGRQPADVHVVTGDGASITHRLADYAAYFRAMRRRFEARLGADKQSVTYPEPVEHCHVCRWYGDCADRRRADDHLSLVAGMTRAFSKALAASGVKTIKALAASADVVLPDLSPKAFDRLRAQSRLQLQQYADGQVRYELILPDPDEPGRGLARLPLPTAKDVFLDFESHPWAGSEGLEYLMGTVVEENDAPAYLARWAHDSAGEKQAFEALIDSIEERRRVDPAMHVYHYGAYERTAIRRLMGRYATREDEVDGLLRGEVLVDLFEVVRQGVRVSQESYSLKKVEKLYMPRRQGPSTQPGFAVVEYERWLRDEDSAILKGIEAYNRDDCVSAWKLRAWLEARRPEAETLFAVTLGRPISKPTDSSENAIAIAEENRKRYEGLVANLPQDPTQRSDDDRARQLLGDLLDWHRREQKPEWWLHFDLKELPIEQLVDRPEALADLTYESVVQQISRSLVHRYRYEPAQEHKFQEGDEPIDLATDKKAGTVYAVDPAKGTIDLIRGKSSKTPHPRTLIPAKPIPITVLRQAIGRVADAVLGAGMDGAGPYRAGRDLLMRRLPRISGEVAGQPLTKPGEDTLDAARRIVPTLDHSYLPIQGPPGSGKTYAAARMILDLVGAGRRVGIAANAHKAITNLVDAVCEAAMETGAKVWIVQKSDGTGGSRNTNVSQVDGSDEVLDALIGGCKVVAGTAWLFARTDMENLLDVLFVDEAGQTSLANVVAMSGTARSIVLLGDPNQLPQVTKGNHPDGAKKSALEHVLGGDATIAPERGLFLTESRRLHPDVCGYISDAFYDGRLLPHPTTRQQTIASGPEIYGTGVRFREVAHDGNAARSSEEAEEVSRLIERLLQRPWTNQKGQTRPLALDDILIVAPYNAQVGEIVRRVDQRVGRRPRVGTVDKFQGQEGAVVVFSMATSSAEDAPRNMEFLYSRNRLNVAISRARALAVLVCNPQLLEVNCRTPDQMRLVNALCLFLERAAAQTTP
jgi:uncharacterized protein